MDATTGYAFSETTLAALITEHGYAEVEKQLDQLLRGASVAAWQTVKSLAHNTNNRIKRGAQQNMTRTKTIEINKRYFMAHRAINDSWSVYDREQKTNPRMFGSIEGTFKKVFDNGTEQECRDWVERNGEEAK